MADNFLKRAEEAESLLTALEERVKTLESGGAKAPEGMILVDPKSEAMTEPARAKLRGMMKELKSNCKKQEEENKRLQKELNKLKGQQGGKKGKKGKQAVPPAAQLDALNEVKKNLKKWRSEVAAVEEENASLKQKVKDMGEKIAQLTSERDQLKKSGGSGMDNEQIETLRAKLVAVRGEVVAYMKKHGDCVDEVEKCEETGADDANAGRTRMNMDTIKERKVYFITTDMAELKREWEVAELGPLDDEDFQLYLGRKIKTIDIEEDDDTVNVRFDNHDTQWFPVVTLYEESAAPAQAAPVQNAFNAGKVQMNMDTIRERKVYYITESMKELKAGWEVAELGPLDDEDFQLYLGREVKSIDLEEDDDTMNIRFDNHDTQWIPVSCLYEKSKSAAPAPAKNAFNEGKVQMNMDTIRERKTYYITESMKELKAGWEAAELGPLDDEDFQLYLGREVKSIDLEEDDDTMNIRFDNHDTQWLPVCCLYSKSAPAAKQVNAGKVQCTMDTIKERKNYYVTEDMAELKAKWAEAELGPLDDSDFQLYLGREVKSIDLEDDDDTMNVRFDNHDTQWFPVTSLYQKK